MTSRCLIERRDAHEPVNAGLSSHQAIGIFAFNSKCYALQTSFLTWLIFDDLRFKFSLLGPFQIHTQEHLGPVLRLSATGARMDSANGVAAIVIAGQQHFGLGLAQIMFESLN